MEQNQKKEQEETKRSFTRRSFLRSSATVAAGISIVPSHVVSGFGQTPPSDKLNIAGIGVGGMGRTNVRHVSSQNIVALCDVDWSYAARAFRDHPAARKFQDYRRMLDEMDKDIDAVIIATADHTHYVTAAAAMRRGKHVYVQKPLTHSVYESRKLKEIALHLKNSHKTVLLVSPLLELPTELTKEVTVVNFPLPGLEELGGLLERITEEVRSCREVRIDFDGGGRERLLQAALGLTAGEAENVFAKILVKMERLTGDIGCRPQELDGLHEGRLNGVYSLLGGDTCH